MMFNLASSLDSRRNDLGNISIVAVESADHDKQLPTSSGHQGLGQRNLKVKDIYRQVIASCISLSFVIQSGISISFSAILLPQLMDPESTFIITPEEASWIASLIAIGTPIGSFISGPLMDYFGRRMLTLICCVPNIIGWLLILLTPNSVWMICVGRLIAGVSGGMATVTGVYVAEITHRQIRPMMLSLNSVFVSFGILLTTILGSYLHWRTVSVCCAGCTIVTFLLTMCVTPESPVWLMKFNHNYANIEKAKKSLLWLNPNKQIFTDEWNKLVTGRSNADQLLQDKESAESSSNENSYCSQLRNSVAPLSSPSVLKPFLIIVVIFVLQQSSGAYPIIFYAVQIFQSVKSDLNEYTALVILGTFRFLTCVLGLSLSGMLGRRTLMIASSLGMVLSSLIAAVTFSQDYNKLSFQGKESTPLIYENTTSNLSIIDSTEFFHNTSSTPFIPTWVGTVSIIVFVGVSSVGVLTIPWTLSSELLPTSFRGTGSGLMVSFAYILMFLIVKCFPILLFTVEVSGLFYIFSLVSFIIILFVYFFLPETLGKSFEEIERYFSKSLNNDEK